MFRNTVSELDLSSARRVRPAVEALEERAMLTGDMGMTMPTTTPMIDSQAIFQVGSVTSVIDSFTRAVKKCLTKFHQGRLSIDDLRHKVARYDRLATVIRDGVAAMEQTHGTAEPFFAQAIDNFNAAIKRFDDQLGRLYALSAIDVFTNQAANMATGLGF